MLHHWPGWSMDKSDALSCRPDHGSGSQDDSNLVPLNADLFAVRALEGVIVEGIKREVWTEIHTKVKEGQMEDSVACMVKGLKESKLCTVMGAEWNLCNGLVYFCDRLYVPMESQLRWKIVEQHHDSKIAGHPDRWKIFELVLHSYWWPQMSCYIGMYCRTCDLCLHIKKDQHAPLGKLQPLEVLTHP